MLNFFNADNEGRIVNVGSCPDADLALQALDGYSLHVGKPSLFSDYIDLDTNEVLPRPTMSLTVTQDPFTITGIPAGTLVTTPGGAVTVDDGFIEWTALEPGTYEIRLENFPYLSEVVYAEIS